MRIAVVGLGYVGLVTSACLAEQGNDVLGVEVSPDRFRVLSEGRMPFHEPGLDHLVSRNVGRDRLRFSQEAEGLKDADVVFVAVGTHDGNGGWQTTTIQACLNQIVPVMADHATLVVRSTLPPEFLAHLPGIVGRIREENGRPAIPVLTNPEFTKEGTAVHDFLEPDRVVIGIASDPDGHGEAILRQLYRNAPGPVIAMSATDAALSKLGANLFLATKISFANELALLCELHGGDVTTVVSAMAFDKRIGGSFLKAGVGFGGSCLPHQVKMTVAAAAERQVDMPLFAAVDAVNHRQRHSLVERVAQVLGGSVAGKRVALLGVTFKPETDDLRDAPSIDIARELVELGATVIAYDPMTSALERWGGLVPGAILAGSIAVAIDGADVAALVTEWREFRELDWPAVAARMRSPRMVDGRNALARGDLLAAGFTYLGFGVGGTARTPSLVPVMDDGTGARSPLALPELAELDGLGDRERMTGGPVAARD